jgi:hypothetical protein
MKMKMEKHDMILVVLASGLFIYILIYFGRGNYPGIEEEKQFISMEIKGKILLLKHQGHGYADIRITRSQNNDTVSFMLHIGKFIDENDIQMGDSVTKSANSRTMIFYKRRGEAVSSATLDYALYIAR